MKFKDRNLGLFNDFHILKNKQKLQRFSKTGRNPAKCDCRGTVVLQGW